MTREEAKSCISTIEMLQRLAYNIHGVMDVIDADNCEKIIKALEQEPSGDLISRQEVIDACEQSINILEAVDRIMDLPSVEQEPKTGHWINDEDTIGCYYCSECGGYVASCDDAYCKYCGAKMVEPQESEDKE